MMKVWTSEQANHWYEKTAWQVGMNYLPSTAVNSTASGFSASAGSSISSQNR